MDIIDEIISKWLQISEYDSEQSSFNPFSADYKFHQVGDRLKIINQYDTYGHFTVLYIKASFESICSRIQIKLIDLLKDRTILNDYFDMWDMLESQEVTSAETSLIQYIKQNSSSSDTLDSSNNEDDMKYLRDSIEYVAEGIKHLNLEAYYLDDNSYVESNIKFHDTIEVFNTTTECVLELEKSENGLYLCYISDHDSCGSYFSFILKYDNNIISMNDRIDEEFVGEHTRSRNNRFIEDKLYNIFPYTDMNEFVGRDYKGYTKSFKCTVNRINICELSIKFRYTILILAKLVAQRFYNRSIHDIVEKDNIQIVYVDTMLSSNSTACEINSIVSVNENSLILNQNRQLEFDFNSDNVRSNELQSKFNYASNSNNKYRGSYSDVNACLIDEYGKDFCLDITKILQRKFPQLMSGSSDDVVSELIGPKAKIELEYYRQCRLQLRDHILMNMQKAYLDAGGYYGVIQWYKQALVDNFDSLLNMVIEWYIRFLNGQEDNTEMCSCGIPVTDDLQISLIQGEQGYYGGPRLHHEFILNKYLGVHNDNKYKCPVNGHVANMWFIISPNAYQNIRRLVNTEIPKILTGFKYTGYSAVAGNDLIHSCDPIGFIHNPFEYSLPSSYKDIFPRASQCSFEVAIGLSKSGLNKLVKCKLSE